MRIRHLAIIALLLVIIGLIRCVPVSGSSSVAIIVYDHGFVSQLVWTARGNFDPSNKTNTFTQDVTTVHAYVTAALYSANLTWLWYNPYGQLYLNRTVDANCNVAPCTFSAPLYLANNPAATMIGLWRVDLLAGGSRLYSDYFSVTAVVTQQDYWNFEIEQSYPFRGHGDLIVTIHPNNGTWNYYEISLPYASNITAYEFGTNQALSLMTYNYSRVLVNLGAPRSDGYKFVLSYDLAFGVHLNSWSGVDFAFTWQDVPWERLGDYHPIPESFNVTLPQGARFVDMVGMNALALNQSVIGELRPSIIFSTTVPPRQRFGWTILYRDLAMLEARNITVTTTTSAEGVTYASQQLIPVLPLTVGSISLWSAVMSVFLVTASELLSPVYSRTGIVINRRRLQYAALVLVSIFLVTTAYQLAVSRSFSLANGKPVTIVAVILLVSILGASSIIHRRRRSKGVSKSVRVPPSIDYESAPSKAFVPPTETTVRPADKLSRDAFQATLEEEKDPRRAIRLAFRFAESFITARLGVERLMNETDSEYYSRVTIQYPFLKKPLTRLLEIYELAQYTSERIEHAERVDAVNAVLELIESSKNLSNV